MTMKAQEDHWSSEAYQSAASFVPKLATKIVQWLDVREDDRILDLGCGDGVLTQQLAQAAGLNGRVHGTDASASMIATASSKYSTPQTTYSVINAQELRAQSSLQQQNFTKVFSNAALHWILRRPETQRDVFVGAYDALQPGGKLCFEMGGMGNVGEMRAALIAAIARRVGIEKARDADPWFFPDEPWMSNMLEDVGFVVEKMELEYRATEATKSDEKGEGGVEGWVRLMGKQFFDVLDQSAREEAIAEVTQNLKTVCESPSGRVLFGYVRLRVLARKP